MPRPTRSQALPRPRVLLVATLLPLLGLWLARPAHAMEALGDAALTEVQAAGWSGLPLSVGDLASVSQLAGPASSRDGLQQVDRQAASLQQFSASVALQTQLAAARRVTALPMLAYVMPSVIPVVGLPLAFFVPPASPH